MEASIVSRLEARLCFLHMTQSPPPPSLEWCLFLDVDGTLVELTDTPSQTVSDPEIKSLLRDLSDRLHGAVALVSGRQIATLDQLFAPLRMPAAGLHGVERRRADGVLQGANFVDTNLDAARAKLQALVAAHPGTLLEDKQRNIAVHFRLAPQSAGEIHAAFAAIAELLGKHYEIQAGDMLLELKPRGFTKGTAIRAFMHEPPFSGRLPVFIGDDLTDQDGFPVVESLGGISIGVGERVQGQYHLDDVAAVRQWLKRITVLHDPHKRPR
jgi:trehalose 6-phosphate phosphatase